MYLKSLELAGFKSFAKKTKLEFKTPITAIVGPNGSGKSNIAEAFRFSLGEQRMTQMRSKKTEDLIWNGSDGVPRARHASVTLTFDNRKKLFDIDFDDAVLERAVHRDASTEYVLNDSTVRLKDIIELLSSAHIGASGHHIISQGETDRILMVNSYERKTIIEDALGLKVYQYKKQESVRKLDRTEQHKKEVESLRREIAPHIKFLKSQVEKIEKTQNMRRELADLYRIYLTAEENRLTKQKKENEEKLKPLRKELEQVRSELATAKKTLETLGDADEKTKELISFEEKLNQKRIEKETLTRELGQLEGEVRARKAAGQAVGQSVPVRDLLNFRTVLEDVLSDGENVSDLDSLKKILHDIREKFTSFITPFTKGVAESDEAYTQAVEKKEKKESELSRVTLEENELVEAYENIRQKIEKDQHSGREAERAVFTLSTQEQELYGSVHSIEDDEVIWKRDTEDLAEEMREARALVGEIPIQKDAGFKDAEERSVIHKQIERLKIRLEDSGSSSGEDVLREYEEVTERDVFLERELEDLDTSVEKLKELIADLDVQLSTLFNDGVKAINAKFQELFALTFDGGTASLEVINDKQEDEEEEKEGIEIRVLLPRKKIRGLHMLSGGERALTSIALLFAMSQVNPPPFILLDETDAALDEANSRRYGDMIEKLASSSQLILITHNRETMSRAGVLYGVTMGRDGVSQLLSVGFDEAIAVAK